MSNISAVIIEDEIPVAKSLEILLRNNLNIEFLGMAHNVNEGEELIQSVKPDLVFCDIQLEKSKTGFDLIERFPNPKFQLIFVTAYNEYAIKAFKYNAIDYLLKPVDNEELESAIEKVKKNNKSGEEIKSLINMVSTPETPPKKLLLKSSEQVRAVNIADIVRLESESNYTSFYLAGGKKILVSKGLKEYSEILEERNFFRAHQSHLINLEYFELYEKQDGGYIIMQDGSSIPVSKRKRNELFELLENL